ncbi:DUF4382 domain-containing protein [Chloroflexota bacterium]
MNENFEEILDKCIDGINSGQSINECLDRYPEHSAELMPLLKTVANTRKAVPFTPMDDKKQEAREQLLAAIGTHDGKGRRPFLVGLFRKTKVWASAAAATAVALIAVFAVGPLLANNPAPAPIQGDFALMISDDATIMDLFQSVEIEIENVGLYHATEGWQDIEFSATIVDLKLLPGEWAQKIWEGELPVGQYTKVRINLSKVNASLIVAEGTFDFEINDVSLAMDITFEITAEDITNFVYDITVINEGATLGSVPEESGSDQEFELISAP